MPVNQKRSASSTADDSEQRTMNYGKEKVAVYRTYASSLEREEFLPSFSEGDNSMVVATDSMKNFVLHQIGEYDGTAIEGFLEFVGSQFLDTYSQMESIQDLIYQIGLRVLERFPQLESVSFEANNRTWIQEHDLDGDAKVLKEPPRPTGSQQFSMDHGDLEVMSE